MEWEPKSMVVAELSRLMTKLGHPIEFVYELSVLLFAAKEKYGDDMYGFAVEEWGRFIPVLYSEGGRALETNRHLTFINIDILLAKFHKRHHLMKKAGEFNPKEPEEEDE